MPSSTRRPYNWMTLFSIDAFIKSVYIEDALTTELHLSQKVPLNVTGDSSFDASEAAPSPLLNTNPFNKYEGVFSHLQDSRFCGKGKHEGEGDSA